MILIQPFCSIFIIVLFIGRTNLFLHSPHGNTLLEKIVSVVGTAPQYQNVVPIYSVLNGFFEENKNYVESMHIERGVKCKDGFFNGAEVFDLHNNEGDLQISVENMHLYSLNLTDKYGHPFTCERDAHKEIETRLHHLIDDDSSSFHKQLVIWNYDVPRTEYHVGNGTHAYVTFVCRRGYHVKLWHDLHLRTHVHVEMDGAIKFHEKMRVCECTPESCAYNVKSYLQTIGVTVINPQLEIHMEKTVCSEAHGGSPNSVFSGEISQDDVACRDPLMELEDDMVVRDCEIENKAKCVKMVNEEETEKSDTAFYIMVGTLILSIVVVLICF